MSASIHRFPSSKPSAPPRSPDAAPVTSTRFRAGIAVGALLTLLPSILLWLPNRSPAPPPAIDFPTAESEAMMAALLRDMQTCPGNLDEDVLIEIDRY